MRLTNNMMTNSYLNNLQRNISRMNQFQNQLSSNRKLVRLSDDPTAAMSTLAIRGKLASLSQYQRNLSDARSWLTQSETSLQEMNEVIKNAYELALQGASDTNDASDRQAVALQIRQLRDHLVQVANSSYGNTFIFGGYATARPPFATAADGTVTCQGINLADPATDPTALEKLKSQAVHYQIGTNLSVQVSINGAELVGTGTDNLFAVFDRLIESLENNGSTADIGQSISQLKQKQVDILALTTDLGGRMNRIDLVASRYEKDQINYETVKSEVEDIDLAEVVMNLKMAESVYQAALSIGSQVIQPSLVDYLK
jgi:flagellar hook-associated protein 3 FlgL